MEISFLQAREKNLGHFSSRISRDRDSCQCLYYQLVLSWYLHLSQSQISQVYTTSLSQSVRDNQTHRLGPSPIKTREVLGNPSPPHLIPFFSEGVPYRIISNYTGLSDFIK